MGKKEVQALDDLSRKVEALRSTLGEIDKIRKELSGSEERIKSIIGDRTAELPAVASDVKTVQGTLDSLTQKHSEIKEIGVTVGGLERKIEEIGLNINGSLQKGFSSVDKAMETTNTKLFDFIQNKEFFQLRFDALRNDLAQMIESSLTAFMTKTGEQFESRIKQLEETLQAWRTEVSPTTVLGTKDVSPAVIASKVRDIEILRELVAHFQKYRGEKHESMRKAEKARDMILDAQTTYAATAARTLREILQIIQKEDREISPDATRVAIQLLLDLQARILAAN